MIGAGVIRRKHELTTIDSVQGKKSERSVAQLREEVNTTEEGDSTGADRSGCEAKEEQTGRRREKEGAGEKGGTRRWVVSECSGKGPVAYTLRDPYGARLLRPRLEAVAALKEEGIRSVEAMKLEIKQTDEIEPRTIAC